MSTNALWVAGEAFKLYDSNYIDLISDILSSRLMAAGHGSMERDRTTTCTVAEGDFVLAVEEQRSACVRNHLRHHSNVLQPSSFVWPVVGADSVGLERDRTTASTLVESGPAPCGETPPQ
jgi:hypothetical protein